MNKIEPKVLVTGTNRGLGKFISNSFSKEVGVFKFTRKDNLEDYIKMLFGTLNQSYDLIIHCAASVSHYKWDDDIPYSFYNDNIFLTKKLLSIPHKKFIYISSIDQQKTSPYGISKKISEALVKEHSKNHLIIRPTGLLGKEMKKNTFQKIIHGESIVLTPNSIMNYVLYDDVLEMALSDKQGVVTLCADGGITMKEVAELVSKNIEYGSIYFDIESHKFKPTLKYSSKENIIRYLEKYEK
jgi:nucleoside-diphosphate-sugar epimerase